MIDNERKNIVNVDYSKLPDGTKALYGMYDLIASSIGMNPGDVESYDCRLMDTSRNGQDAIYEKASAEVQETAQITMALALSGMKVDDSLPPNTVTIYRGGMVLKDGKDVLDVYHGKELSLFLSGDCISGSKRDNYFKRILVLKPERTPSFVSEKGYYDMFTSDRSFKDSVDKTVELFPQQHMKGAHVHER